MLAKAANTKSRTVNRTVDRAVDRNDWPGFDTRPAHKPRDNGQGFYESSFDLRTGLEVIEAPLLVLPEDLAHELRRQQSG